MIYFSALATKNHGGGSVLRSALTALPCDLHVSVPDGAAFLENHIHNEFPSVMMKMMRMATVRPAAKDFKEALKIKENNKNIKKN